MSILRAASMLALIALAITRAAPSAANETTRLALVVGVNQGRPSAPKLLRGDRSTMSLSRGT